MTSGLGLGAARRQAVAAGPAAAASSMSLPLTIELDARVDLAAWAASHAEDIATWLHRHGAVLFRGASSGVANFAGTAAALAGPALPYVERSSPRTEIAPGVYTSTEYPADQAIALHNENSYQHVFPARLVFGCVVAARRGGATPLADCRRVLAQIDPDVVDAFRERGVCYVRTYSPGLGLSWQEVFQESDPELVAEYCRTAGVDVHWRDDGTLQTRQVRPALAVHPHTGEEVWFNHAAFFHVSSLPAAVREGLLAQVGEEGLPTQSCYGDGGPIEPEVVAALRRAYASQAVAVPWQRDDVLLVDNMLVAHGREPFAGPRQVVVSMAGALRHVTPVPTGQPA